MSEDVYIGSGESSDRGSFYEGDSSGAGDTGGGGGEAGGGQPRDFFKALDYPSILALIARRFESGEIARNRPHLIGLIIGRPAEPLLAEQILPALAYWHHRTATYVDFFCVGFTRA